MKGSKIKNWLRSDRFLALLILLAITLLVLPTIDSRGTQRFVGYTCLTLVFIVGALANRRQSTIFGLTMAIGGIAAVLTWGRLATGTDVLDSPRLVFSIGFFAFMAVIILVAVIRDHISTQQAVYGAICAYLLMGLGWAHAYLLIEKYETEPFHFVERELGPPLADGTETTALSQMIYFSFVTMTTLGLGDITPRGPLVQTVTWMQAVAGQLFLAVLIARLVSEMPKSERTGRS